MTLGGRGLSAGRVLIAAVLVGWVGGCGANVYPPVNLTDPIPIYFAQYNVHSTVIFPLGGKFVDYTFGDWNYAALRHKFITDAFFGLTFSKASALERRVLDADPRTHAPIFHDGPDAVIRLYAERRAVQNRLAALQRRFDHDVKVHPADGMVVYPNADEYVMDPQHYGLHNNCNHMTAESLRALGFRVEGPIMTDNFRICPPQVAQ